MTARLAPAEPDDLGLLARLWHGLWWETHAPLVPEDLRALRTPENFHDRSRRRLTETRIARSDGEIAGFCMLKGAELYQLYLRPEARGTGLARTLLADAEDRLRAAGVTQSWLYCLIGNHRAARFYDRSGWHHAGSEEARFDTPRGLYPLTVWRFEKPLAPDAQRRPGETGSGTAADAAAAADADADAAAPPGRDRETGWWPGACVAPPAQG